ncbi:MAG: ATP-dependent zinc metalloprotease FtsH [Clostridiales bacterium]|nr:ATP-dependent zinc metalloprotease FtsH [Clostridiales bacterium]
MNNKYLRTFSVWAVVFLVILFALAAVRLMSPPVTTVPYTYADLLKDLDAGNVTAIEIMPDEEVSNVGTAVVKMNDETVHSVVIPSVDVFMPYAQEASEEFGFTIDTVPPPKAGWLAQLLPSLLILVVSVVIMMFILQQVQGGGRMKSFGKSKARMLVDEKRRVTFSHVAGLEEEKAELSEIVDFLKAPKKYIDIGARIPKGVLLVGPPGTGKTFLARAVAGEAGVPFYSISGSDFVEMYVGVGASRVRDLFDQAKRHPASIVIIDEIDAVGRRRGAGLGGGHDEREQTLNQLLVEMDGFGVNEGVIILAATNRPDILDPALLRPGRFDRQIVVNKPDVKGREAVLSIHSDGKKLAADVSLKTVAQTTAGFSPADLENLMNEAALLAARDNKTRIDMESIRRAFVKVGIGTEKKSRVITERERRITAYHEAGHAICHEVLSDIDPTYMVSVIPTGMAGGYTMPLPGEDRGYITKKFMEQTIVSLLGGRAAETLVIKDITTGASNDIERATGLARNMVVKYGMSEVLGPIQFGNDNEEVFIGRDFAHARNYGEQVASLIDSEIKRVVEDGYEEALRLIEKYIDVLHKIANLLMEKEKVSGEEIRKLFPEGALEPIEREEGLMGEGLETGILNA